MVYVLCMSPMSWGMWVFFIIINTKKHLSNTAGHASAVYYNGLCERSELQLKMWESVSLMILMSLAVEYARECIYSFCHYETQSIILQASRFQTNSKLE